MAKGQHLSSYQKKIVDRYYEHHGTIKLTQLQELISDLAVAESDKAKDKLWKKADQVIATLDVDKAKAARIIEARDLKALAEFIGKLNPGSKPAQRRES